VLILLIALAALIGAGVTFVVCYFLPKQKVKERNEEIFKEEEQAQERIKRLDVEYQSKNALLQSNYEREELQLLAKMREEHDSWELTKSSEESAFLREIQQLKLELKSLEEKKTSTLALIDELKN